MHVVCVDITLSLHRFSTLPEVPNKSHHRMSNEKPLIDYKSIMIMNEHYLVAFEQKMVRKEVPTQDQDVRKEQLLTSKCARKTKKKHQ
jgi:hypothetical protein